MATLDDKILGEKLHNYCSSSEDEDGADDDEKSGDEEERASKVAAATKVSEPAPSINDWSGTASNTGPKGVIEDWKRFKQLEAENRKEMEKERIKMAKKFTMSTRTQREEEEAKKQEELEDELNELVDEEFLLMYQKQRLEELMAQLHKAPNFGTVITLNTRDEFLDAVDKEDPKVTVVIHIYNNRAPACETMDGCLKVLAKEFPEVKFCRIAVAITRLSRQFNADGVPALLVYKGGRMIGNFVSMSGELGEDFFAMDVKRFLTEHGLLPEK